MDVARSINPLRQIIAGRQCCSHLFGVHAAVLGAILRVLPLKELHAILRVRFPTKMAVRRCLLILRLTKRQRHGNCSWTTVKFHLDNVSDVVRCERALSSAIRLDEQ